MKFDHAVDLILRCMYSMTVRRNLLCPVLLWKMMSSQELFLANGNCNHMCRLIFDKLSFGQRFFLVVAISILLDRGHPRNLMVDHHSP